MAAIAGKSGFVRYGSTSTYMKVARLTNWTANIQSDILDTTAFSTDGVVWRSVTPGINGWSASFSGHQDLVTAATTSQRLILTRLLTPTTGTVRLEFDETNADALQGSVFIENLSFDVPVEGVQGISGTLRGNGALIFTTTT